MARKAININTINKFISSLDTASEESGSKPTVFKLRTLDSYVTAHLQDNLLSDVGIQEGNNVNLKLGLNNLVLEACKFGIADVENLLDEKGNQIKWKLKDFYLGNKSYKVADPELLASIPFEVLQEIKEELYSFNSSKEEDIKN